MKERPIIFSDSMVRAILEGKKTQTRRIVKPQPKNKDEINYEPGDIRVIGGREVSARLEKMHRLRARSGGDRGGYLRAKDYLCPYGIEGDRLWVRETFRIARPFTGDLDHDMTTQVVRYYADDHPKYRDQDKWRPSIHMPRAASRITLDLIGVRVERLQEIGTGDCIAEGIWTEPPPGAVGQKFPDDIDSWTEERREEWFKGSARAMYMAQCHHEGELREVFCQLWTNIHGEDSWPDNPWVWVIDFKGGAS